MELRSATKPKGEKGTAVPRRMETDASISPPLSAAAPADVAPMPINSRPSPKPMPTQPPAASQTTATAMSGTHKAMEEEEEVPREASSYLTATATPTCQVTQDVLSAAVNAVCERAEEEIEGKHGEEAAEPIFPVADSVAATATAVAAPAMTDLAMTSSSGFGAERREEMEEVVSSVAAAGDGVPAAAPPAPPIATAAPVNLALPGALLPLSDPAEQQQQQQQEGQVPVASAPSVAAASVAPAVTEDKVDQAVDMLPAKVGTERTEPSSMTAPVVEEKHQQHHHQQQQQEGDDAMEVATPTAKGNAAEERDTASTAAPTPSPSSSSSSSSSSSISTPTTLAALHSQLQAAHTQTATAQAHCLQLGELGRKRVAALRAMVLREVKEEAQSVFAKCQADVGQLGKTLVGLVEKERARAADLAVALGKEAMRRRQLFNALQEMRGNIRVLCRVRPSSSPSSVPPSLSLKGGGLGVAVVSSTEVSIRTDRMGPSAAVKVFELDAVLGPENDQAAVWAEVQPLVTSAMDGYQACILAFGQTGSGKTFTMEGTGGGKVVPAAAAAAAAADSVVMKGGGVEEEAMEEVVEGGDDAPSSSSSSSSSTDDLPSTAGVNPRALAELFRLKEEKEERGLATVKVSVSMVEIYNENVRDLLASPPSLPPLPPGVDKAKDKGYQAALAARRRWQPPSLEIKHQQPPPPPTATTARGSSSSSSVGSSSNSGSSSSTSSGSQKKGPSSSSSSSVGSTRSSKSSSSSSSSANNTSSSSSSNSSKSSSNKSSSSSTATSTSASGVAGGAVYLPGAVSLPVDRAEDVAKIMRMGQRHRTVAATKANQASSRSHSLLLVSVHTKDIATGIISTGRLILVDLAGSERLGKTGAEGVALKEAQNINKSLSALGDVIQALRARQEGGKKVGGGVGKEEGRQEQHHHIPFRNSKLTYLLQDALGSENKCCMVVCVSPEAEDSGESLCSLTFAQRVHGVVLGAAKAHGGKHDTRAHKEAVMRAKQEVKEVEAGREEALRKVGEVEGELAEARDAHGAAVREGERLTAALMAAEEGRKGQEEMWGEEKERYERALEEAQRQWQAARHAANRLKEEHHLELEQQKMHVEELIIEKEKLHAQLTAMTAASQPPQRLMLTNSTPRRVPVSKEKRVAAAAVAAAAVVAGVVGGGEEGPSTALAPVLPAAAPAVPVSTATSSGSSKFSSSSIIATTGSSSNKSSSSSSSSAAAASTSSTNALKRALEAAEREGCYMHKAQPTTPSVPSFLFPTSIHTSSISSTSASSATAAVPAAAPAAEAAIEVLPAKRQKKVTFMIPSPSPGAPIQEEAPLSDSPYEQYEEGDEEGKKGMEEEGELWEEGDENHPHTTHYRTTPYKKKQRQGSLAPPSFTHRSAAPPMTTTTTTTTAPATILASSSSKLMTGAATTAARPLMMKNNGSNSSGSSNYNGMSSSVGTGGGLASLGMPARVMQPSSSSSSSSITSAGSMSSASLRRAAARVPAAMPSKTAPAVASGGGGGGSGSGGVGSGAERLKERVPWSSSSTDSPTSLSGASDGSKGGVSEKSGGAAGGGGGGRWR